MTRALVLGVNGQDGSYLAEALLRRGYEVAGCGRQAQSRYLPESTTARFRYHRLDLTDAPALEGLLTALDPDVVFHFAAIHGAAGFAYEPLWGDV
ncbi:MAG: GDP-mannose 4,6-dehydratase, partial [Alphaproteobacteria bacterium]